MAFFGLKLGLDFEMRAVHPHQKFQEVPLPGLMPSGKCHPPFKQLGPGIQWVSVACSDRGYCMEIYVVAA